MKSLLKISILLFLAQSIALAKEEFPAEAFANCAKKIRSAVSEDAERTGHPEPAYELSEPTPNPGKVCVPRRCPFSCGCDEIHLPGHYEYSSSVFFTEEGYISGSGISARVEMNQNSCEILSLDVKWGN